MQVFENMFSIAKNPLKLNRFNEQEAPFDIKLIK